MPRDGGGVQNLRHENGLVGGAKQQTMGGGYVHRTLCCKTNRVADEGGRGRHVLDATAKRQRSMSATLALREHLLQGGKLAHLEPSEAARSQAGGEEGEGEERGAHGDSGVYNVHDGNRVRPRG